MSACSHRLWAPIWASMWFRVIRSRRLPIWYLPVLGYVAPIPILVHACILGGFALEIPDHLLDPIDLRLFIDPVVLPTSGRTVSKHTIVNNKWRGRKPGIGGDRWDRCCHHGSVLCINAIR